MPSVLIASCASVLGKDEDEPLLLAALAEVGIDAAAADWSDPAVDWTAADAVVVRSTWDYAPRRDEFLAWARRVDAATRLFNPADVLAWNTDKRYLGELAVAGVPVVPTVYVETVDDLDTVLADGDDVVLKPTVSAGARDTARFRAGENAAARDFGAAILAGGRTVMVQPYLARLEGDGETGLVYLDGTFSHAFSKGAMLAGEALGSGLYAEEQIDPRTATPEQRAVGDAVLAAIAGRTAGPLLYARVDLVPGADGTAMVLELELTEPSLFLTTSDGAPERFAEVIAARLG